MSEAPVSQTAPSAADEALLKKAKAIHERALTIDTHVDIPGANYDPGVDNLRTKCNLPKMEKGGLKGVFLAVFVGQSSQLNEQSYAAAYKSAMQKFEAAHNVAEKLYPERCALATSPADVARIAKTGKRVLMIGIENGFVIGTDLSLVKKYYDLGARYITLSHQGDNQICDSANNSQHLNNGLSSFGQQVVAEMNKLGIMVDVSHIAEKSFWDVIKVSQAPIIASHSGCRAVCDNPRNLTDEQLKALKKNGGVIQVVALGSYLKGDSPERAQAIAKLRAEIGLNRFDMAGRRNWTQEQQAEYAKLNQTLQARMKEVDAVYPPPKPATITDFVDHIDHAVKVIGVDHVGIGTDFDGGGGVPGFNDDSEAPNVTLELVKRGYSEQDIDKIWGGNLLRVWREVEKKSNRQKITGCCRSRGPGQVEDAMELTSWDKIEAEQLSDKITRRALHGRHATVARFSLAQGSVVARHAHESEQCSVVLSGAIKMIFDSHEVVLRPGDVLLISPHEPHAAEALEDTTVQDIFALRREDWIRKDDSYLRR